LLDVSRTDTHSFQLNNGITVRPLFPQLAIKSPSRYKILIPVAIFLYRQQTQSGKLQDKAPEGGISGSHKRKSAFSFSVIRPASSAS